MTLLRAVILALVIIAAHSASADSSAGQEALEAGNVDEALSRWRFAADEGDGRAMVALGRLSLQGLGVL